MAFFGQLLHAGHKVVAVGHGGFIHVGAVDDGLGGQQAQFTPGLEEGLVVGQFEGAGAVTGIEVLQQALHDLCGGLGVLAALGHLLQLFQAAFHALQVGQQKFGLDGIDVAQGIHAAVHMGDVLILEAAHHFHDGGAFADVAQELVAQAFALAGAAHQTGDVDEVHAGVDGLLGRDLGRKRVHALVGHGHGGLVGFDGTERIVGGLRVLSLGQGVEQGGFPHVGQTHNADAEGHGLSLRAWKFRAMRRWRRRKKGAGAPGTCRWNGEFIGKSRTAGKYGGSERPHGPRWRWTACPGVRHDSVSWMRGVAPPCFRPLQDLACLLK